MNVSQVVESMLEPFSWYILQDIWLMHIAVMAYSLKPHTQLNKAQSGKMLDVPTVKISKYKKQMLSQVTIFYKLKEVLLDTFLLD